MNKCSYIKNMASKKASKALYICESICTPKYFKQYYYSDKKEFFAGYGFELERMEKCDVTFAAVLKK